MGHQSTKDAIFKFIEKNESRNSREPTRKNKKPEKDVEKQVFEWAKISGFHLHVVDSSSYDPIAGRSTVAKASVGFPDLCGNTNSGFSVWIELKAKDCRNRLSPQQREFLQLKIHQGCFAVVVDSAMRLDQYWRGFRSLKTTPLRTAYLLECLPKKVPQRGRGKKVPKDDLPF